MQLWSRQRLGRGREGKLACAPQWEELAGRTDFPSSHMRPIRQTCALVHVHSPVGSTEVGKGIQCPLRSPVLHDRRCALVRLYKCLYSLFYQVTFVSAAVKNPTRGPGLAV